MRYFGWSHNPLFDNQSTSNWFVFIDKLYFGAKSPESFQCYAHEWSPAEGRKVVYCQTVDPVGNVIPVDSSSLGDIYVRHENSDWTPLTALAPPVPPIELEMRLLPNVLSSKSNGKYVTAVVKMPEDVELDGDSLDVSLCFEVENSADKTVNERVLQPAKATDVVKRVINGNRVLIFKLPRKDITSLPAGEVTVKLSGQIYSDQAVEARGTILVR